jgi:16S rRNA (guanine(966)-N(2))-methyltransferase RsmD
MARGVKLVTLEGTDTRPTTDRIKENIFNIIGTAIYDSRVLDLFSGSGALGIEAASRGAESVVLVEQNRQCKTVIETNLTKTKLQDHVSLMLMDVDQALNRMKGQKFDVVFMDPPYGKSHVQRVLDRLNTDDIVNENGIIIVEHHMDDEMRDDYSLFSIEKQKKYGITGVTIYRRKQA